MGIQRCTKREIVHTGTEAPGASIKSMLRGMAGYGCYSLSLCDPDAAVASAWYSVGTAWQVVALSDMELGLPPETKTYASGEYGDMALLPYKKPIYMHLIL